MSCYTCDKFAEFTQPHKLHDGATVYGSCLKNYHGTSGGTNLVYIPDGQCKAHNTNGQMDLWEAEPCADLGDC